MTQAVNAAYRQRLQELARRLPYQRAKDSPTIPHYTDWKRLKPIEEKPHATHPAPLNPPPGLDPDTWITPTGTHTSNTIIQPLTPQDLEEWPIPIENRLDAAHATRWKHGALITKPGQAIIAIPAGADGYHAAHIQAHQPPGTRLTLTILSHSPPRKPKSYTIHATLPENAELELAVIEASKGPIHAVIRINQHPHSKATIKILAAPGEMTRLKTTTRQTTATTHQLKAATLNNNSKLDLITDAYVTGRSPTTTITHKGYTQNNAQAVHRGTARITRNARNARATIDTTFTLLEDTSTAIAVPILEVDTGEVDEARHSATIARPDPTTTFYLQQRGLTPKETQTLQIISAIKTLEIKQTQPQQLLQWITQT